MLRDLRVTKGQVLPFGEHGELFEELFLVVCRLCFVLSSVLRISPPAQRQSTCSPPAVVEGPVAQLRLHTLFFAVGSKGFDKSAEDHLIEHCLFWR